MRVIYAGLPMWLCRNEDCSTGWGFWSWLPLLYFNGRFMAYQGSYVIALWRWLTLPA